MFAKKNNDDPTLDDVITSLLIQMDSHDAHSAEYAQMADQLTKLYEMKNQKKFNRPSADTLAVVGGNLAGILLILNFERAGVITSKALGFVMKTKV